MRAPIAPDEENTEKKKERDSEKRFFAERIMFSNSWKAATSHRAGGKLYAEGVSKSQKEEFYESASFRGVFEFVEGLLNEYKGKKLDDEAHFKNIKALQKKLKALLNKKNNMFDKNGAIVKIATAQKLLNLMLKHWWAAGYLEGGEPPHCPIDGELYEAICRNAADKNLGEDVRNASKEARNELEGLANGGARFSWTSDLEDKKGCRYENSNYKTAIEALRKAAGEKSLALWELEEYNKRWKSLG